MQDRGAGHGIHFEIVDADDADVNRSGNAAGKRSGGGPVPAILDQATAQWALKLGGVGARFTLPVDAGPALFEIVGLLEPGILQGYVLVSTEGTNGFVIVDALQLIPAEAAPVVVGMMFNAAARAR
jgi:hypothetical protein